MHHTSGSSRSAADRPHVSRSAAVAGLLLLGLLLFGMVGHEARSGRNTAFPAPIRASTVVEVAAQGDRARMVNPIVAAAADTAGGRSAILELPADHRTLLDVDPDDFGGTVQATLNSALISPFVGGRIRVAEYDAVLTSTALEALQRSGSLVAYPRDVWALPAEGDAGTVRLYVDPSRTQVYVLEPAVLEGSW